MRKVCLCLLLLLPPFAGGAAELRSVTVDRVNHRYVLQSEVWFDTDLDSIYATFLDYDVAWRFTSFIVESHNVAPSENGQRRFYIRNRGCVLFFCKSFERNGHIEHHPREFIRSIADPDNSDFHWSLESWRFTEEGTGTLVAYDFEFEPKFWIPPLIGPYVLKRKLRNDSGDAIHRIEAIAQNWQH